MDLHQSARTVAVTARSRSRFARLRLRYPSRRVPALAGVGGRGCCEAVYPCYNAELSMELLARTGDLPESTRDLIALLAEYRHALYALATQAAVSKAT